MTEVSVKLTPLWIKVTLKYFKLTCNCSNLNFNSTLTLLGSICYISQYFRYHGNKGWSVVKFSDTLIKDYLTYLFVHLLHKQFFLLRLTSKIHSTAIVCYIVSCSSHLNLIDNFVLKFSYGHYHGNRGWELQTGSGRQCNQFFENLSKKFGAAWLQKNGLSHW